MASIEQRLGLATNIPKNVDLPLTHFQQQYDWDCGLSCILMILPKRKQEIFIENFQRICKEGGFNRSTWTIDLCFILREFNVPFSFLTKTIGVDPSFEDHSYYRNLIPREEGRVNAKFAKAFQEQMAIERRTISFDTLVGHVALHRPAILLTNSALLCCYVCRSGEMFGTRRYSGHYVVICGYDLERRIVRFRDPAKYDHVCTTSFELMNQARTDHGTDEDVILIYT